MGNSKSTKIHYQIFIKSESGNADMRHWRIEKVDNLKYEKLDLNKRNWKNYNSQISKVLIKNVFVQVWISISKLLLHKIPSTFHDVRKFQRVI